MANGTTAENPTLSEERYAVLDFVLEKNASLPVFLVLAEIAPQKVRRKCQRYRTRCERVISASPTTINLLKKFISITRFW